MGLKNKYAIVGVGYTPQGKVPGRTSLSFHLEACSNAIIDAGLKHRFSHLTNDKSESVIEAALLKISTEISAGYEQSSFHGRTGALYDMTVIFWRMFCQIP
jgi:acetyl-CoA acetyltransferase